MPQWLGIILIVLGVIVGLLFVGVLILYFKLFGRIDYADLQSPIPDIADKIVTTLVSDGYDSPIALAFDNVNPNYYYVIDQVGKIYRTDVENGVDKQVVLDITREIAPYIAPLDERGLLSVDFDRRAGFDFAYVTMTTAPTEREQSTYSNRLDHTLVMRRYAITRNGDRVEFTSPVDLVRIPELEKYHHGGSVQTAVGQPWLMMVSSDGGPQDDPFNHAQDLSIAKGKILVFNYNILDSLAQSNVPLNEKTAADFIFVYGVRNAWKIYYHSPTDTLYVGDVGNQTAESAFAINNVTFLLASNKKVNLRWSAYEGFIAKDVDKLKTDQNTLLLEPIFSYRTGGKMGRVIIMGFPISTNELLIGDYLTGNMMILRKHNNIYKPTYLGNEFSFLTFLTSFGTDAMGNRYVLTTKTIYPSTSGNSGKIYRIDVQ